MRRCAGGPTPTAYFPRGRSLRPVNRNDRAISTFTGLGHGSLHGYELTIPLFVPIWLGEFDVSATELGVVPGVGFAMTGVLAPAAGFFADRYGSKRLVVVTAGQTMAESGRTRRSIPPTVC